MSITEPVYVAAGVGGAGFIIAAFFIYKFFNNNQGHEDKDNIYKTFKIAPTNAQPTVDNSSFINKMKNTGRRVVVFYGSQTGTADDFANRLAKEGTRFGLKGMAVDLEDIDSEDLSRLSGIENSLAIFCMATYGEGDPTDNAHEFYDWLKEGNASLTGVKFVVFGLGNKTYKQYNAVGKYVDKRLEELGAERVYDLGLGDDDANIEDDFVIWKEDMWAAVFAKFGITKESCDINMRQYALKEFAQDEIAEEKIFTGEITRLGALKNQKPVFDLKNPFLAKVIANRELHTAGDRSCIHVELDISNSRMRYEAGDHVAVYATNDSKLVDAIGVRLGVNLDQVFSLINLDADSNKKHPFPCPCTYRTALTHYLDITSPVKTNVLGELSDYATDDKEKQMLKTMMSSTHEGREHYLKWVVSDRRHILACLEDLPSLRPPIDLLCEILPRLQVRYYSISSSPKLYPTSIHVTAAVVDYTTNTGRQMKGVATTYLKEAKPEVCNDNLVTEKQQGVKVPVGSLVPVFVRRSVFRLPFKVTTPIVMVGPGTGFAPFRGFIQERDFARKEGKPVAETILYTGFRNRAEDFLYAEELLSYEASGSISKLYLAFSRDQAHKIYVQHLMLQEENKKELWEILEKGGYFYICGDAKNMARDVLNALEDIIISEGNMSRERAQDYIKSMQNKGRYSADVWS